MNLHCHLLIPQLLKEVAQHHGDRLFGVSLPTMRSLDIDSVAEGAAPAIAIVRRDQADNLAGAILDDPVKRIVVGTSSRRLFGPLPDALSRLREPEPIEVAR